MLARWFVSSSSLLGPNDQDGALTNFVLCHTQTGSRFFFCFLLLLMNVPTVISPLE